MALITELIANYWDYLNPTGSIRSKGRYFLTGAIHRAFRPSPIENSNPSTRFTALQYQFDQLISEYKDAFSDGNIEIYSQHIRGDQDKLLAFNNRFLNFAQSPSRISQSIEGSMVSQAKEDAGMILQLQHHTCVVGVTNNHTILTMVDFLLSDKDNTQETFIRMGQSDVEIYLEKESSLFSTNIRMDYKGDGSRLANLQANFASQVGWICTNTTDKVKSSIKAPTMSSKAYKAYSMNQLIEEMRASEADIERFLQ